MEILSHEIAEICKQIAEVEIKIRHAEENGNAEENGLTDFKKTSFWRKKELQLRTKKIKLRTKELNLRTKELNLRTLLLKKDEMLRNEKEKLRNREERKITLLTRSGLIGE